MRGMRSGPYLAMRLNPIWETRKRDERLGKRKGKNLSLNNRKCKKRSKRKRRERRGKRNNKKREREKKKKKKQ